MSRIDTWIEPCAGMAAVAMRLYGLDPIIPWMGGKRGYAPAIMAGLDVPIRHAPERLVLADAGPAGAFWSALLGPDGDAVVERIEALAAPVTSEPEARAFWYTHAKRPEVASGEDAAAWVLAAGLSFRAGDVTSGYVGTPPGEVMRGLLGRRPSAILRDARKCRGLLPRGVVYRDASSVPVEVYGRTVIYIDPPYLGTKGYAADLSREAVVGLAMRWHEAGADVLVSEREPMVPGWRAVRIVATGTGTRGGAWEYLTLSPGLHWHAAQEVDLWGGMDRAPSGSQMTGGVR